MAYEINLEDGILKRALGKMLGDLHGYVVVEFYDGEWGYYPEDSQEADWVRKYGMMMTKPVERAYEMNVTETDGLIRVDLLPLNLDVSTQR